MKEEALKSGVHQAFPFHAADTIMGRNMGYLLHKEKTNGKQPQNSPLSPV
jgi:hypothetical protein